VAGGLRTWLFQRAAERVMWRLRVSLFQSLISQEVGFYDRVRTGERGGRGGAVGAWAGMGGGDGGSGVGAATWRGPGAGGAACTHRDLQFSTWEVGARLPRPSGRPLPSSLQMSSVSSVCRPPAPLHTTPAPNCTITHTHTQNTHTHKNTHR
jgi:hypothetical protein